MRKGKFRLRINAESNTELYRFPIGSIDYVDFHSCFVISSRKVFIGDIDLWEYSDRFERVKEIIELEKEFNLRFKIYLTHSGIRFIEVSRRFKFSENEELIRDIFERLDCDSNYQEMCFDTLTFRARLTPKARRNEPIVCTEIYREGIEIEDKEIKEFVIFHDLLTL